MLQWQRTFRGGLLVHGCRRHRCVVQPRRGWAGHFARQLRPAAQAVRQLSLSAWMQGRHGGAP
eukprot:10509104-Lingulodinium_polyedra.AAC.1